MQGNFFPGDSLDTPIFHKTMLFFRGLMPRELRFGHLSLTQPMTWSVEVEREGMVKIGDVFVIPLRDDRFAYGQYVYKGSLGQMIIVFDLLTNDEIRDVNGLLNVNILFPPVFTGFSAAIRSGLWRKIGKLPVNDYSTTQFISSWWDDTTGEIYHWSFWNGEKFIRLGKNLPAKYKSLEYLVVWSPFDITWRIENNQVPYPYGEMIKYGKFIPRRETSI